MDGTTSEAFAFRSDAQAESVSLLVNFFPAILNTTTVTVWSGKFNGPQETEDLRRGHPGLVTWRDPDDGKRLYVWNPNDLSEPPAGFQEVTVALQESPRCSKN